MTEDTVYSWKSSHLLNIFKIYDDDEIEEQLKTLTNQNKEDYEEQLDELREEIKQTNELVRGNENRLKNIEALLTQIHAGSISKE